MNWHQKEHELNIILAYLRFMAHATAPYEGSLDIQSSDLSFVLADLAERLDKAKING